LGTIAHDHHFFQRFGVGFERNINSRPVIDGHFLGGITNKRSHQRAGAIGYLQGEIATAISGGTIGSAF
jgi:hypothetical protein